MPNNRCMRECQSKLDVNSLINFPRASAPDAKHFNQNVGKVEFWVARGTQTLDPRTQLRVRFNEILSRTK